LSASGSPLKRFSDPVPPFVFYILLREFLPVLGPRLPICFPPPTRPPVPSRQSASCSVSSFIHFVSSAPSLFHPPLARRPVVPPRKTRLVTIYFSPGFYCVFALSNFRPNSYPRLDPKFFCQGVLCWLLSLSVYFFFIFLALFFFPPCEIRCVNNPLPCFFFPP